MGQRTKWGNCSGRRNLSFNWRLILAPDYVLRYLVTHEAVHLAVPDGRSGRRTGDSPVASLSAVLPA